MLFVTDDALRLACSDRSYPRADIAAALQRSSERQLLVPPASMLNLPPRSNLFFWNTAMFNLALAFAITEDERFRDHLLGLVGVLSENGWKQAKLDGHLHVPFIVSALC